MRAIFGRAVAPAKATFQDLHDAANDAPTILPFDASHLRGEVRSVPIARRSAKRDCFASSREVASLCEQFFRVDKWSDYRG